MTIKKTIPAVLFLAVLLLNGCSKEADGRSSSRDTAGPVSENAVWITYWGQENVIEQLEESNVGTVCLFGADFDASGCLTVQKNTVELAGELSASGRKKLFLTVVNDIVSEDGNNSLKDTDLLYELFGTEEAMHVHINRLLDTARSYGFDGIEIDYERIRKDDALWRLFTRFLKELSAAASEKGLALRVVLEPGTPVETLSLPEGPDYVVMCYNLYGIGTEPGPKAGKEFLLSLKEKFASIPGIGYALANGGYVWDDAGGCSSITTGNAKKLASEKGITPVRDEESKAMHFTYTENDVQYTVWYGDDGTIEAWMQILNAEEEGIPISLWRMNG